MSLSLSLRGVVGTKSDEIRERRVVGVVGVGASGPSGADGRRSCGSFDVIRRSLGRSVRKWRPEKSQLLTLTFCGLSGGRRHLGTSGFGILNRFDCCCCNNQLLHKVRKDGGGRRRVIELMRRRDRLITATPQGGGGGGGSGGGRLRRLCCGGGGPIAGRLKDGIEDKS